MERGGRFEVRDAPGLHWLLALLFFGIGGVFVLAPLGLAENAHTLRGWERALSLVMGGIGVAVGLWLFDQAPYSRLRLDGAARRVSIVRRGLRGRHVAGWPVADVMRVRLVENTDDEGGAVFQVHLVLRDGRTVPVSLLWAHGRTPVTDVATRLAAALGVPYTAAP